MMGDGVVLRVAARGGIFGFGCTHFVVGASGRFLHLSTLIFDGAENILGFEHAHNQTSFFAFAT
jgi:hypothetical protein